MDYGRICIDWGGENPLEKKERVKHHHHNQNCNRKKHACTILPRLLRRERTREITDGETRVVRCIREGERPRMLENTPETKYLAHCRVERVCVCV